jgi:Ca2+-binding RTX toxin-like protein
MRATAHTRLRRGTRTVIAALALALALALVPAAWAVPADPTVQMTVAPTNRPAPGGTFVYDVTVTNNDANQVTLTSLTDDVYGDVTTVHANVLATSCATGGPIAASDTYNCSFTASFNGPVGDSTSTVTAVVTAADNTTAQGSGSATITITEPPPPAAGGGPGISIPGFPPDVGGPIREGFNPDGQGTVRRSCAGITATIVGTTGNDVLRGTPGRDVFVALAGNDVVKGLGGGDLFCGGPGVDRLRGGAGNDTLNGNSGPDRLAGGPGSDTLAGNAGDDRLRGGPGSDTCAGGAGVDTKAGCES